MQTSTVRSVLVLIVLATVTGCQATGIHEETATGDDALRNATLAPTEDFPSTVRLRGGGTTCTAARVGPRLFLTAAHCMAGVRGVELVRGSHTIRAAIDDLDLYEPAATLRACRARDCSKATPADADISDVAVLELAEHIAVPEAISITPVDTRPVRPGETIHVLGFGCQVLGGNTDGKLRTGVTTAVPFSVDFLAPSSAFREGDAPRNLPENYFVAALIDPQGRPLPAICPGDSGGPVFRNDRRAIVGVNSIFVERASLFARLDTESTHRIGHWLDNLGVATTK